MVERIDVTVMLLLYGVVLALLLTVPLAVAGGAQSRPLAGPSDPHVLDRRPRLPGVLARHHADHRVQRRLGLFPVSGYGEDFLSHLHHLFLPALAIALALSAVLTRNLRASLLAELEADYVAAARAKGMPERWIFAATCFRTR